jgi:hypothetical protein
MEPSDLLRYVTTTLERLGLRYFVTGSVATIFFGEPRFTNDIDIVADLPPDRIRELCSAFPAEEFYLDEEAVRRAVARQRQFNILHPASGLKVDIMVPANDAFNRSRFSRVRRLKPEPDYDAAFASPEDVILKKLEYYREGGSEKHLRDIGGILRISGAQIDFAYVDDWSSRRGLAEIWEKVRSAAAEEEAQRT